MHVRRVCWASTLNLVSAVAASPPRVQVCPSQDAPRPPPPFSQTPQHQRSTLHTVTVQHHAIRLIDALACVLGCALPKVTLNVWMSNSEFVSESDVRRVTTGTDLSRKCPAPRAAVARSRSIRRSDWSRSSPNDSVGSRDSSMAQSSKTALKHLDWTRQHIEDNGQPRNYAVFTTEAERGRRHRSEKPF